MTEFRPEPLKIYVASSWRNPIQPTIVKLLKQFGNDVYDFRNPPKRSGFGWHEIDPNWEQWTTEQYRAALSHPLANSGYDSDMDGMEWADACVLVLPCGRSAHAEAGWFSGSRKPVIAFIPQDCEPELMYKMFDGIAASSEELVLMLSGGRFAVRRYRDGTFVTEIPYTNYYGETTSPKEARRYLSVALATQVANWVEGEVVELEEKSFC